MIRAPLPRRRLILFALALFTPAWTPGCGEPAVAPTRPYQPPPPSKTPPPPATARPRPAPIATQPATRPAAEATLTRTRDPNAETQVELAESAHVLTGVNLRLVDLFCLAYRPVPAGGHSSLPLLSDVRVLNAPLTAERYDLRIYVPGATAEALRGQLRALLRRHFGLVARIEARTVDALVLVRSARPDRTGSEPPLAPAGLDRVELSGSDMSMLAEQLEERLRQPVLDETGLRQPFLLRLHRPHGAEGHGAGFDLPTIRVALQKQLGVDLVPGRRVVDYVALEPAGR